MNTIKKKQIAQALAEKAGASKKDGEMWLENFIEMMTSHMRKGDKINLSGFGIFKVAARAAREGRNPRTGETIQIKASKKVRFTPAKVLKEAVL
jgi:DNA-binding protein HU-beta